MISVLAIFNCSLALRLSFLASFESSSSNGTAASFGGWYTPDERSLSLPRPLESAGPSSPTCAARRSGRMIELQP